MGAADLGPLDWRTPIVDEAGRPSPEFQRRWNTQRNNNALIGTLTLGSGVPAAVPAPSDGAEYVDISAAPAVLYVGSGGVWRVAGVRDFTGLADVPAAYTSAGSKLLRVNAGATGLEFKALSDVLDALGATRGDVLYRGAAGWAALGPGTSGQMLTSGGAGADPSWTTPSAGGGGQHEYEGFGALPAAATFTPINQSHSTLTDGSPSLLLTTGGQGSTVSCELYDKVSPGTGADFDLYARCMTFANNSTNNPEVGIFLRNSSTGSFVTWGLSIVGTDPTLVESRWNSPTSRSAKDVTYAFNTQWLRMHFNHTTNNITIFASRDGVNWSTSLNQILIPGVSAGADHMGIYTMNFGGSTLNLLGYFGSFGTTAPA